MYKVQFISLWYVPKILCDIVSNIAHFGQVCNARHAEWPLGHYSTEKEKMTRFHTHFVLQTYFHRCRVKSLHYSKIQFKKPQCTKSYKKTVTCITNFEVLSCPNYDDYVQFLFFYLMGTNDLALHLNFYWFLTWDNFSI